MTLKKVFSGITSVGFSGNLLDTTTNYAVFNAPASWQGQNRLWIKLPKGIWNVTIEYEGDSAFFVDGLLSTPTNKVDKLVYSNRDKAFAVRIQQPSSSADNVIVGMTKYQDPLSLSLVESAAAWLRRWRHGAKADRKHQGLFLHGSHPRRAIMGYRHDSRMGKSQQDFAHARFRNVCSNSNRWGFLRFYRAGELLKTVRDSSLQIQRPPSCNGVCA